MIVTNPHRHAGWWLVGLVLLAAGGCKQEGGAAPAMPTPQVEIQTVTLQSVPDEPEFIGQAEASRPVEIRSQVTGIIQSVLFPEGRDVKKGAQLYRIDPVPFQAAFQSARAKVAQAEARLIQAKQNLARVKPLLQEQAVSQKDLDDAVAEELAAKAALEGAKAEVVKANFDMSNTLITAPIAGLIERSRFYEGRLVSAQTDLLTVIHRVDPMYVVVNVPETFILKRRRDIEMKRIQHPGVYQLRGVLTFMDGSAYEHEGVFDLLEPGLRSETGSRQARVSFPNPDRKLLPGQFLKLRFKGDTKTNAVLVPQRAVLQGPKGPFVYVVGAEDKVEMHDVTATDWQGGQWLIEAGLKAGDRVVVNGLLRIAPGMPVKPVEVSAAGAPSSDAPPSSATSQDK